MTNNVFAIPEENFAAHNSLCLIRSISASYLEITEFWPVTPNTHFGETGAKE